MRIPFRRFVWPAAVLGGMFVCFVAQLSAQAVPPTTSTYFTDPQPTITVNGNQMILHKELYGYPNYGVTDGAADILYTGQAATWHFSLPSSVQPSQVQAAFFRASLVADDHGNGPSPYSLAVWVDGSFLSSGLANLPYGTPYGSRFNNWVSKDYPITSVSQSLTLTLQNTSAAGPGDWIAVDWVGLQLTLTGGSPPLSGEFVYVGNQGTNNISGYSVDPSSGALTPIPGSPFAVAGSPWSIAIHPSGKFAYATGGFSDNINGYAIDPHSGALSPLPGAPFATSSGDIIAMHSSGNFAYVTNGNGTNVSVYTINSQTGALALSGYSNVLPVTRRTMVVHPSGKFVYMTQECVLNGNVCNGSAVASVQAYAVDPNTGALAPIPGSPFPAPMGSYPSLAADPTGDFLYLGNGYGPVMAYRVDLSTGALAPSAGAADEPTYAIAVAPQGHLIFDSSINGLSAYRVDPASGLFTSVPGSPWPSGLSLALSVDCTGKFLYVANWYSSSVSGYAINAQTGALSAVPGSPFPAGNSPGAIAATCTTPVDTTPPVIVPQVTGTLGNNGWYRSRVAVSWSVTDPESGIKNSSGCTTTNLTTDTAGMTLICSATNGAGLSASVSVTIKIDQTPPVIAGMPAPGCSLWPPNGKMVTVATVTAADALSGLDPNTFQVTGTSNEPPSGPEISITPNGAGGYVIALQAARSGSGTGRIYTLTATASDLAGNTAAVTATCTVPHDQGN